VYECKTGRGQDSVWAPSGARLNKAGLPWASYQLDQQQWLQVDLKREKRITGTAAHQRQYLFNATRRVIT